MLHQPLTTDAPVVISLFGAFTLQVHGTVVTNFYSNKSRALLIYLLLEQPQPLLRSAISALLWAGYAPASARTSLRQALTHLRSKLAPVDLLQGNHTYLQLRQEPTLFWCDVHRFEALLDACRAHNHPTLARCPVCRPLLQQAITLYQGALLEAFPTIDSAPFNDWLQSQRQRLATRFADAQAALVEGAKPLGNLPPPLTPLVGRAQQLTTLAAQMRHTPLRCVTLEGPGGIGKTRLAVALGAQMQPRFPAGVWLVELGELAPTTPAEPLAQLQDRLATAIASALGLTFYGTTPPTMQVMRHLADKTALLILDGFEHLAASAAWLPTLLAAAPQLWLLLTTRQRLPLQNQLVYPVEGLDVPPDEVIMAQPLPNLLAQYAGLQLFVERAESAGLPLSLARATLAIVGQICRFVEGSPWAIEVAVALLDRHSPDAILAAIQQNYRALTTPLIDVPERQRSAEAVFLTTWRLLTPSEAQTLARCSVFRGGFTLHAAQHVAGATLAPLEALVQKSLLRIQRDQGGAPRYAMHDLVRQFAGEQLAHDPLITQQSQAAHAAYFTALLATWQPDDATEQRFRAAVTQDWENVQAAWGWALDQAQLALLQPAVTGLAEFYEMAGLYLEFDRTFARAVARVRSLLDTEAPPEPDAPPPALATTTLLAHLLGRWIHLLSGALGQLDAAQQLAEELLVWGRRLAEETLTAWAYYALSLVAFRQGDFGRQAALLHQALLLAQQQNDQHAQARYLMVMGISLKMQHDYAAAQDHFVTALTLAQGLRANRLALLIRNNLGACYLDAGQFGQAIACFQQTLPSAQQAGQQDSATFAQVALGLLAYTLGDYANARTQLTAAQQGYHALGDKVLEAQLLNLLATLLMEMGEATLATDYCQRALAISVDQLYLVQRSALLIQGQLARADGNWAAARTAFEAAYTLSRQTDVLTEWLPVQFYLAQLYLVQGDVVAAGVALEPLLPSLADASFEPWQRPQALLLIAYQILVVNADPRAPAILQQAWQRVQAQLAQIDDPRLRHTFLTNVPVNRELAQLIG